MEKEERLTPYKVMDVKHKCQVCVVEWGSDLETYQAPWSQVFVNTLTDPMYWLPGLEIRLRKGYYAPTEIKKKK